jgi:polyhydroxybutyrate depolymerase
MRARLRSRTARRRRTRAALALALATRLLAASTAAADAPPASTTAKPSGAASAVAPRPSAGCAQPRIATGRRIEQTIDVGGVARAYILDVPETLRPGEPAALLFDFHGVGHSGAGVWDVSGFKDFAPRERFITVYPTGLPVSFTRGDRTFGGPGWEIRSLAPNRDVDFTLAMLDHLEKSYCIDRARVYSTGFSNGGFFSHVLACTHPDRFSAIAPVSGGWLPSWPCKPSRAVPVLIQHGTRDEVIDVAEARRAFDAWLAIDGCTAPAPDATRPDGDLTCRSGTGCRDGVEVTLCEGSFAHRWPVSATERVWHFLREHPF